MARNGLAGSHSSYDKRGMSRASIAKKKAYDTAYHKTESRKKYRAELNKKNKDAGTYGNGDGKDMSHTKSGGMVMEGKSRNRARNGSNNESTKK